jgi:hypothetical protein
MSNRSRAPGVNRPTKPRVVCAPHCSVYLAPVHHADASDMAKFSRQTRREPAQRAYKLYFAADNVTF